MWTKLLKSSFLLGLLLVGIRSFAATTELSLEDLRQEVLTRNLDIRIQYEKYAQAQQAVGQARGEFLPGISVQLIYVNTTFAILQSIVPIPADWFAYQASQELSVAERFTTESIKLNILEGLTINFLTIKYYEEQLVSLREQEKSLEAVYVRAQAQVDLGQAVANEAFMARRALYEHRQNIYNLASLIAAEKQALLIALSRNPSDQLELGEVSEDSLASMPQTKQEAADLAVRNSAELLSNSYQARGASLMNASRRWSFISFNGIGFDYAAINAIQQSKARVIALQGEQIEIRIRNQVYTSYEQLEILDQRIAIQGQVLEAMRANQARQEELYTGNLVGLNTVMDARAATTGEERSLLKLRTDRNIKIAQIKRLLGIDGSLNEVDLAQYHTLALGSSSVRMRGNRGGLRIEVTGAENLLANIFSVDYTVEGSSARGTRVLRAQDGFAFSFGRPAGRSVTVRARVNLLTGQVIELEQNF